MESGLLFVTGFGPFEGVPENPSGLLARALDREGGMVGVELPVTFEGSARAWDEAFARLTRPPTALLSMGVHPGSALRIEVRARPHLRSTKLDNEGRCGADLSGRMGGGAGDLETNLDPPPLIAALRSGGWRGAIECSRDAGGYVCERIYRHVLVRAAEQGIPGLFLHVPPLERASLEELLGPVTALARHLGRGVS